MHPGLILLHLAPGSGRLSAVAREHCAAYGGLGGMFMFVIIGLILSGIGLFALISGQPYGIWYPILMVGLMFSIIPGALIPVIRKNYQQAENRRIAAESIRVG